MREARGAPTHRRLEGVGPGGAIAPSKSYEARFPTCAVNASLMMARGGPGHGEPLGERYGRK